VNISAERAKWLASQKKRTKELELERKREKDIDKERERERLEEKKRGHGGGLDEWEREVHDRDRERQAEYRERLHLRETLDRFAEYKPDINLDHFDDHGNKLNEKEVRLTPSTLPVQECHSSKSLVTNCLSRYTRLQTKTRMAI
jgi:hypothetical protein